MTKKIFLGVLIVFALFMVQGVAAGEYYKLVDSWGGQGPGNGKFQAPMGVATDAAGNVYVADNFGSDLFSPGAVSRIHKFDAEGNFQKNWSPYISNAYMNYGISGIAVGGPSGDIYVNIMAIVPLAEGSSAITMDNYIQTFRKDGTSKAMWGPYSSSTVDLEAQTLQVQAPLDIAVDAEGNAYVTFVEMSTVTRTGKSGILKFAPGTIDPVVLVESTLQQGGEMEFYYGIDVDSTGRLYVTKNGLSTARRHIQKYDTAGNFIIQWDIQNIGGEQPDMLGGISVGPDGNVYIINQPVTEETSYIQKYGPNGTYISQGEPFGEGDGQTVNPFLGELGGPLGIEVAPVGGKVYVVDASTYQVLAFEKDVTGSTNLVVSVTGSPGIEPGQYITYTLSYYNFGYNTAYDVVLEDFLDDHVDVVSASVPYYYDASTDSVKWTIGTLNPGEQRTITLVVEVPAFVPEGIKITNRVVLHSSTIDTQPNDNEGSFDSTVIPPVLPRGITVGPSRGAGPGSVIVYWDEPITFTYRDPAPDSCIESIKITVAAAGNFDPIIRYLVKDVDGLWGTTIFRFRPLHDEALVTYHIHNTCKPDEQKNFNMYIDPAGYIYDIDTGARILGASVWLERPDGNGGWENVPMGESPAVMDPDTNPLITDTNGQYQWDVLEGSYRVHVVAPGYFPADSIVVSIPPAVTDLHVGLKKMDNTPVPEFPSAFLPATMIIGFLGAVLLIQRTREH